MRNFSLQIAYQRSLLSFLSFKASLALLVTAGALVFSAKADTAAFHTSDEIRETAKIFLEKMTYAADNPNIEVKVNQIDPRLKLRKCSNELLTELSRGSKVKGKVTVSVSCKFPVAWKIFITAEIAEYSEVIVAARSMPRRTTITENDIERKSVNIAVLRKQPILASDLVVGSTTKRNINKGRLIYEDSVCMVCRGDNVQITAKSEFFSINMEAVALADAGIGETTLVRNKQSKRSFTAKVVSRDRLEVTL